jgi:hypothetical protein
MINHKYFADVLPDQIRLMERAVRLTVHLTSGEQYDVHTLVAAHETYVVLKIYTKNDPPKHSKPWREANPAQDAAIYDEVCIPYSSIAVAHVTARATKGDDARALMGFQQK